MGRMWIRLVATACLLAMLSACTLLPTRRGDPPGFEAGARPETRDPYPNWAVPPHDVEPLLASPPLEIVNVQEAGGGTTGALRVTLRLPAHAEPVDFKWKAMLGQRTFGFLPGVPQMLDGVNNAPRKELAAWRIQRLFLDPEEYVVPTSVAYCWPRTGEGGDPELPGPVLEGSDCALGLLSLWLQQVTFPDPLLDAERFARDPVYARYLANFNLLTYLIAHRDGREGNFLASKDDARRQVFAIDNGVSFSGFFYNWFVANWDEIRVPALRRESIDRLRELTQEDLARALGVVAELHLDEDSLFRNAPPGPNLDDDDGVRFEDGVLQLGLTDDEIEDVWERLEDLLEDVDDGDVPVF
ncbi:MAG: hypothetical protein QNK03_15715 [Myxococcota bacterium]|nr:hypothetical protein [Myxococcota bacterium]